MLFLRTGPCLPRAAISGTFYSSLRKDFNHGLGRQKLPGQNPEEEGDVEGKKEVKIRACALAVADLASPGGSGRFGREALSHSRNL